MFRIIFVALTFIAASPSVMAAEPGAPLTMEEAVAIALDAGDPSVLQFEEKSLALEDRAVADAQLPDPKLKLSATNLPVDTFRFGQEPMTQAQIGLQQAFPRGKTLRYRGEKREAEASSQRALQKLQERQIVLDTRTTWLELFYWRGAQGKVTESRQAVSELREIASSIFSTGRRSAQDVLRADLELRILDDRLVEVERRRDVNRANLTRLIGVEASQRPLAEQLPAHPELPDRMALRDRLVDHPSIEASDSEIDARKSDINIARQQYKPGFTLNGGYGVRGGDRPDFATVGVTLDIPIFTGKRQDRNVSAAQRNRGAAEMSRRARLLELDRMLAGAYADQARLEQRISLYKMSVLSRASETTEATLTAYQNDLSDFAELVRARLAELDVELTLLRLRVDRAQVMAKLDYLAGENNE
jgi:outer membrane protein TolC